jgi:hypothetical protein
MGRYYFNIKDGGTLIPDPEGEDLSDESAVYVAVKETVEDIAHRPYAYGGLRRWMRREFVVTDEGGGTVLTVPVATLLHPN